MARFGRDIVRSLTQPDFADQVSSVGMLLGGAPRARREEEERQERLVREKDAFKIYNEGIRSSEDANVAGVTSAVNRLSGMLTGETDEAVSSDLMKKITALGNLQETTMAKKKVRNVDDLIQAENFLEELKANQGPPTDNEALVMKGVQERVDQLRQDATVVQAAESRRRDARIENLTKNEALAVARVNAMKRDLARYPVGSPEFKALAKRYSDAGMSVEVDQLQNDLLTIQTERADLNAKLRENEPLTQEEKKIIEDLGFSVTGNIRADRTTLNKITEAKFEKQLAIALRQLDPASAALAKALVFEGLNEVIVEGEIEQLPIAQDLSDKVEKLMKDPEEIELLLGKVENAAPVEINSIVLDHLRKKFPSEFKDMETEIKRKSTVAATRQGALAEIAVATNQARGKAAFDAGIIDENRSLTPDDEGYFDLSNPDDAERAILIYERGERKNREEGSGLPGERRAQKRGEAGRATSSGSRGSRASPSPSTFRDLFPGQAGVGGQMNRNRNRSGS